MQNISEKTQRCPDCDNSLQVNEGFTSWCEKCDWNLETNKEETPVTFVQKIFLSLGDKYGKSLFDSLVNAKPENLKPEISFPLFSAFFISTLIHSITIICLLFGLYLLFFHWSNLFLIILGIVLLVFSWIARPRIAPVPIDIVSRQEFQHLYSFVDKIADSLDAESIYGIIINEEFNAAFGQVGWTNKKVLYIGLPLWSVLESKEKIALVSHELSHGINGDPMRGFFVGTAIHSLIEWQFILYPEELLESGTGIEGLVLLPWNLFLRYLSFAIRLLANILLSLLFVNSQKAEYLADHLATKVCGTNAMVSLLKNQEIAGGRFNFIVQRFATRNLKSDLFEALRADILNLPEKEKERILRLSKMEKLRLDLTHPPTFFRQEFLLNHFQDVKDDILTDIDFEMIDKEISKLKPEIQDKAIDIYRAYL